jgi:hypothetical protein
MNVLKKNTLPTFEIVPRRDLDTEKAHSFLAENEFTHETQFIRATIAKKINGNYNITLDEFPDGEKLAYEIKDVKEVVSMGKMLIIEENQSVQDYEPINSKKYY